MGFYEKPAVTIRKKGVYGNLKRSEWKEYVVKDLKSLKWQNFVALLIAGIINAIGVTMLLAPVKLFDSGLSGTALLLSQITPLSLSFFLIVLNVPFYILGLKKQGLAFTVYSIFAVAVYSVVAFLIQDVLPIEVAASSPITGTDVFLSAIFGGMVSGVGSGLTIRYGGAIDGVDVIAVVFAKYIGLTVGSFVMIYNAVLYVTAAFIFSSWVIPLYSLVAYAIGVKTIDFIVEGFDKAKAAMIVTTEDKSDLIAKEISDNLGRGITILNGHGFYSKAEKTVLYCVVNRFQIGRLKKIVAGLDDHAFVTISDVSDTLGTSVKLSRKYKTKVQSGAAQSEENREAVAEGQTADGGDGQA